MMPGFRPVAGSATLVDSFDGDSNTVSNQSATSLLVRAVLDASLPVGFGLGFQAFLKLVLLVALNRRINAAGFGFVEHIEPSE